MKKVLILTVTAGNGHNSCAYAMQKKLRQSPDVKVKVVDLMKEYSTKTIKWVVDKGYSLSVAHFLKFYNIGYNHYRKSPPKNRYRCAAQRLSCSVLKGLYEEIWRFRPDVIYTTHFYGAIALTDLRMYCKIPPKVFVCCLDYVNSPFWEAGIGVDCISLPNSDFVQTFLDLGYEKSQIAVTGLPVSEKFYHCLSKHEAREKLELDPDKFTVLMMFGGGLWSGSNKMFRQLIKILDFPAQVIKINGRDFRGYRKIQRRVDNHRYPKHLSVTNIAFTEDVASYMSAADCVISKCGGLSLTECINSRTPLIATSRLAAQETHNLQYAQSKGCAVSFSNKKQLSDHIHRLYNSAEELQRAEVACEAMRTDGITELAQMILSQPVAVYDEAEKVASHNIKKGVKCALKIADKQLHRKAK